jgi:molybdate transport system substrate-binding protein
MRVAAAANFTAAMKEIVRGFEAATGHPTVPSYGSTGKLYTQIVNGAPYDVFLAADQTRPERLVREGRASGQFTYATGRLVLWSPQPDLVDEGGAVLGDGGFRRLAIANPKTAPYGAAAMEVLAALGVDDALTPKLVRGDSISQTRQFVASGAAELGVLALAQIVLDAGGSRWVIPQALHTPIRQDAVLLARGADKPAARAFMHYLHGPEARSVIERYGYAVP